MTAIDTIAEKRSPAIVTHKRRLNRAIRELFSETSNQVAFVCECETARCLSVV